MISTPSAPDPVATAQAQAKYNQQTGMTQQAMNMVDQTTPWGSSTYDQTGTQTIIGADGQPITVPKYSQTTTLSPQQQGIFDQSQQAQSNLAGLASDQSAAMADYLKTPFSYNNNDASQFAYDLASPRILAQQQQNEDQLRTTLANKGIREGSAAWNAEMNRMTNANSDQLNQLTLNGQQQGFNQALQTRQEPIDEIGSLLSGSQVSNPQFAATPQTGVAGVDYTGLVNNQYQDQLQSNNAMMGGLFGLAGTIGGGLMKNPTALATMFSDRRLKANIRRVGRLDNGLPVYAYTMGDGPTQIGIMADEAVTIHPEAVHLDPSGYYKVDYAKATEAA